MALCNKQHWTTNCGSILTDLPLLQTKWGKWGTVCLCIGWRTFQTGMLCYKDLSWYWTCKNNEIILKHNHLFQCKEDSCNFAQCKWLDRCWPILFYFDKKIRMQLNVSPQRQQHKEYSIFSMLLQNTNLDCAFNSHISFRLRAVNEIAKSRLTCIKT